MPFTNEHTDFLSVILEYLSALSLIFPHFEAVLRQLLSPLYEEKPLIYKPKDEQQSDSEVTLPIS